MRLMCQIATKIDYMMTKLETSGSLTIYGKEKHLIDLLPAKDILHFWNKPWFNCFPNR